MNIVRALDVALPELPTRAIRKTPPRLDPRVISKEHIENGQPVVLVKMPGSDLVFRFTPPQWELLQMFDGNRSHEEIAECFRKQTSSAISEDDVKEFGSFLQSHSALLYKTAVERNIILHQEMSSSRSKRSRFHGLDFSDITIKTWHNADGYITWLYPKVKFLFTPWFVWTSISMFVLMGWMWAERFGEIWSDSFAFYNFTHKSGNDLLEFWFLFGAMAAIHETAHGLVGKHFGATIEKMGFTLMYFAPSFFCDATQVWVMGGKWARIATALAGIWLDLVICFFASIVWWGTATGMPVHDWAYKVMMVTGIGVSLLNLNPLIKLDGYLIFSELVAEPSLKESSTAYLSGWVRTRIFGLPGEVPYVPKRKRTFFVIYGILSGLYSYSLLSILMVISYHVFRSFIPEWALLPSAGIGFWVFRSRIKLMADFMKLLYLDKKERLRAWGTRLRLAIVGTVAIVIFFLPIWPDFVAGLFVLSPAQAALLRATVPGVVSDVAVREGEHVSAGQPLLQLRNLRLGSEVDKARTELSEATFQATGAALKYANFGAAEQERQYRAENYRLLSEKSKKLAIISPISGVVMTPHTVDLGGRSVGEGELLLEVADTSVMKGLVYLPEFSMHEIRHGAQVRFLVPGQAVPISGVLSMVSAASAPIPAGLVPKEQLQGINPPRYYVGTVLLQNNGTLIAGMTGSAKVFVARRSAAGFCFIFVREATRRKIW